MQSKAAIMTRAEMHTFNMCPSFDVNLDIMATCLLRSLSIRPLHSFDFKVIETG